MLFQPEHVSPLWSNPILFHSQSVANIMWEIIKSDLETEPLQVSGQDSSIFWHRVHFLILVPPKIVDSLYLVAPSLTILIGFKTIFTIFYHFWSVFCIIFLTISESIWLFLTISHFSSAQDCGQLEQLWHGADWGQQRDPGVRGLGVPGARGGLEEGGRQGDHGGQEQHWWVTRALPLDSVSALWMFGNIP